MEEQQDVSLCCRNFAKVLVSREEGEAILPVTSQYFEIQDIMSGIIGSWQLIDGQLFLLKGFPGDNHLGTTWSLSRT